MRSRHPLPVSWLTPDLSPDNLGMPSGMQFGDGLFETLLIQQGRCLLWHRHWERLIRGCQQLGFSPLPDEGRVQDYISHVIGQRSGILKIMVVRHAGERGYAYTPGWRLNVQFSPGPVATPDAVDVVTLAYTLSGPALHGLKHMNRLDQVLANRELNGRAWEGWVRSPSGGWVDGIRTNLVLCESSGAVHVPDASPYGVNGVCREALIDWLSETGVRVYNAPVSLELIDNARAAAVMNAIHGLVPVRCLNGRPLNTRLMTEWRSLLNAWIHTKSQIIPDN